MKKTTNENELQIPPHRTDLADLIVQKSHQIKQEINPNFLFFFVAQPLQGFSAVLMLLFAFFIGFNFAEKSSLQQVEQTSVIDEIYNSNSQIL